MTRPIVLMISDHHTSVFVYHAIRNLGVTHVIQEDGPTEHRPQSLKEWLIHQYIRWATPFMRWTSQKRIQEVRKRYPLNDLSIPPHHIIHVSSLNDDKTMMWLEKLAPELIVVHETGPIEPSRLNQLPCPILTIRPSMAEGQLQAYWAIQHQPSFCETTLEQWTTQGWRVLERVVIYKGGTDNFATYPYLQLTTVLPMLRRHIETMDSMKTDHRQIKVQA
ncbi:MULTISPECIES: hypothetical protein [unclassified Exiguobacterium]|uniref:hypothetical protein n=1 Tax=unclassified Exiguobacterium TaxID=2644629 RepID=UPI001BE76253|nr:MULTISPECIES: hypothetical protein [unclassified Exiguobacterium]